MGGMMSDDEFVWINIVFWCPLFLTWIRNVSAYGSFEKGRSKTHYYYYGGQLKYIQKDEYTQTNYKYLKTAYDVVIKQKLSEDNFF